MSIMKIGPDGECWICGRGEDLDNLAVGPVKIEFENEELAVDLCLLCYGILKGSLQDDLNANSPDLDKIYG